MFKTEEKPEKRTEASSTAQMMQTMNVGKTKQVASPGTVATVIPKKESGWESYKLGQGPNQQWESVTEEDMRVLRPHEGLRPKKDPIPDYDYIDTDEDSVASEGICTLL